ncbi:MAG: glyceraldehyde 3-phosphate dehydrogenase NAD-binding domain-containing protein, partial [Fidelibacterota bacterium]
MNKLKIGIMGFGRIGREFYRLAQQNDHLDIVAIVDLAKPEILHYLQNIDGFKPGEIKLEGNYLISRNSRTRIFQAKEPSNVPWDVFGVDTVVDCTHK